MDFQIHSNQPLRGTLGQQDRFRAESISGTQTESQLPVVVYLSECVKVMGEMCPSDLLLMMLVKSHLKMNFF
jgi:hypothetical protein